MIHYLYKKIGRRIAASKNRGVSKRRRACFIYYTTFKYSAITYREAKVLLEEGFEVDILCTRTSAKEKLFQTFKGMNLYLLQVRSSSRETFPLYFIKLGLFCFKVFIWLSIMTIYKRYELIHVTSPPDFIIFSAIIPKLFGGKVILDIHDIGPEFIMKKLQLKENSFVVKLVWIMEKLSASFADHVITVTDSWKAKLISRSVPLPKCSVLLNVPDEDLFKRRFVTSFKESDSFNIYYHGSLEDYFGVDTLLKAIPLMQKEISNLRVNILGNGRLLGDLQRLTETLKISNYAKFVGTVPFYDLSDVLINADIGVVPTRATSFSNEAVSMKSLEYMSLGIPVAISRTKGHSYYFGESMVEFFDPDNEQDLARAVVRLYRSAEKRRSLVKNAYWFIQMNGWNQAKKVYLGIVNSLTSG
jgi:glycosyltransferase involved in cell wall biosynthesis